MKLSSANIYIDIDGVILTKGATPAQYLDQFLDYILGNYSVFWLTSRCHGDTKYTISYLSQFLPANTIRRIKKIKPTNFRIDKTEAIDFRKKFFWLDDDIFASEANILKQHDKYGSWIEVNLMKNPNQLLHLIRNKLSVS